MGCNYIAYRTFKGSTEKIWFNSKRMCAIKVTLKTGLLWYMFNVYLPCDQYKFIDIYIVLSEISTYCLINKVSMCSWLLIGYGPLPLLVQNVD